MTDATKEPLRVWVVSGDGPWIDLKLYKPTSHELGEGDMVTEHVAIPRDEWEAMRRQVRAAMARTESL